MPFSSKLLYHTDSVHFALALERYDITVHQPHPPGYFLYVMLGRFLNLFIKDANTVFVTISVVFSGLAVVSIYYLGKEIYDNRIGLLAAAIAITSPNFWFHGEVAMSYIVEAFFSTVVAYLCWRLCRGEHKYMWLSVVALGIAGGIRQNSLVFLLPLWLFSVRRLPIKKVVLSLGLLVSVCLLWFAPMVSMTGGWEAYRGAFRELWLFHTGRFTVFERGWGSLRYSSSVLFRFIFYGVGAGIFALGIAAYSLIRKGRIHFLDRHKALFFSLWVLPSTLFYLLIFIHPTNPGYVLLFLPALFILVAVSAEYLSDDAPLPLKEGGLRRGRLLIPLASILIISNAAIFFFSKLPVSRVEIRNHDRDLTVMLNKIRGFDPSGTAVFVKPYTFFNFRHIMYYLPEYRVYQVDVRIAPTGEMRKTFWGMGRKTFITDEIVLPEGIDTFIVPLLEDEIDKVRDIQQVRTAKLETSDPLYLAFGNITLIKEVCPELSVRLSARYGNDML